MNLALRPATSEDFDFLWHASRHQDTMRSYVDETWGWDDARQLSHFQNGFKPAEREIIEIDAKPVGYISVERHEARIFLASIEIAPVYQSRGIGTQLIRALIEEADRMGIPIDLQVLKVNPARELYERLGFAITEITETHCIMRRVPVSQISSSLSQRDV